MLLRQNLVRLADMQLESCIHFGVAPGHTGILVVDKPGLSSSLPANCPDSLVEENAGDEGRGFDEIRIRRVAGNTWSARHNMRCWGL